MNTYNTYKNAYKDNIMILIMSNYSIFNHSNLLSAIYASAKIFLHTHPHRKVKLYLAMFPAAETMELWDMAATRLIPCPSAPRSYTWQTREHIKRHSKP